MGLNVYVKGVGIEKLDRKVLVGQVIRYQIDKDLIGQMISIK